MPKKGERVRTHEEEEEARLLFLMALTEGFFVFFFFQAKYVACVTLEELGRDRWFSLRS